MYMISTSTSKETTGTKKNYIDLQVLQNQTIQNKNHGLKLLFDTGAAAHVCPSWFGEHYPLYVNPNLRVQGADGTEIQVHGLRTVYFKMVPEVTHPIAITFIVCDLNQPILSFPQRFK